MKLATLKNGRPDGQLVVVSRDLGRFVSAGRIAPHLQAALDAWETSAPALEDLARALDAGQIAAQPFDPALALAPLPRAYQWIDATAYLSHLERVRALQGSKDDSPGASRPLLRQGASDSLAAAGDAILVADDDQGVDFEAEIAVILGPVPMRPTRGQAIAAIRLVTVCNDVSLRKLVADDIETGSGVFHGKPATAFAPAVATPGELGPAWRDQRLHLKLRVTLNGKPFGQPDTGTDMHFDFADLIMAAAQTRALGCGTILASGTVSNRHDDPLPTKPGGIGFASIAELRTVERVRYGRARTPFLKAGDRVAIAAIDGAEAPVFGTIAQTVTLL